MWLITTRGFYSAVDNRPGKWNSTGKRGTLKVRARCKKDLDNLADLLPKGVTPINHAGTDYPWRIIVKKRDWAKVVKALAEEIDYDNFKDEVKRVQGSHRAHIYGDLWWNLLSIESEDPYASANPMWGGYSGTGYFGSLSKSGDLGKSSDLLEEPLYSYLDPNLVPEFPDDTKHDPMICGQTHGLIAGHFHEEFHRDH